MKYRNLSFGEAINEGTRQAMRASEDAVLFGLGVDSPVGVFGSTKGLAEEFGSNRVFDTPVSEQALTAMAAGMATTGLRPILVHQRLDFMLYTMDMIVNWISLWHFKSAGQSKMPLVIRMIVGKGWGQGPQHAKTLHSWFAHIPGLKVVVPGSPSDAKGLMLESIFSDDPVLIVEYRSLYSMTEDVLEKPYRIPFGKAAMRKKGNDLTIVSFGGAVPLALQAANALMEKNHSADVIDLRTVSPLDFSTIESSVSKTGRLLVVEPGWGPCSVSSEICSRVAETFSVRNKLVRIGRINWPFSHVPTSHMLENQFYPKTEDVLSKALELIDG